MLEVKKRAGKNMIEATEKIRKFNKEVFIIAQSAYVQDNFQLKATEAGCDAFVSKPIDVQKLLTAINDFNSK